MTHYRNNLDPTPENPFGTITQIVEKPDLRDYHSAFDGDYQDDLSVYESSQSIRIPLTFKTDKEVLVEGVDFNWKYELICDIKINKSGWHEVTEWVYMNASLGEEGKHKRKVAVPIEPVKENKTEFFLPPDHGDICWEVGSETFTRKEVFYLLWTQRAMIHNDMKNNCWKDLPETAKEILENPRIPKF